MGGRHSWKDATFESSTKSIIIRLNETAFSGCKWRKASDLSNKGKLNSLLLSCLSDLCRALKASHIPVKLVVFASAFITTTPRGLGVALTTLRVSVAV